MPPSGFCISYRNGLEKSGKKECKDFLPLILNTLGIAVSLLMMQEVVLAEHTHQFMLCLVQPINWATIPPCVYAWSYRKRHQAHDNNKTYQKRHPAHDTNKICKSKKFNQEILKLL
jgi:hypothetical protein